MSADNPNYSIAEIGQNTEKSPGESRELVTTQIPVKKSQGVNNNNNNNNNKSKNVFSNFFNYLYKYSDKQ